MPRSPPTSSPRPGVLECVDADRVGGGLPARRSGPVVPTLDQVQASQRRHRVELVGRGVVERDVVAGMTGGVGQLMGDVDATQTGIVDASYDVNAAVRIRAGFDAPSVGVVAARVWAERLDEQSPPRAEMAGGRCDAALLGGAARKHEEGAHRAHGHVVVGAGQLEVREVLLEHADPGACGVGADPVDHGAAGLDPVDGDSALHQRDGEPPGPQPELEDPPARPCRVGEGGDGRLRREPGPIDAVVHGRMAVAVLAGTRVDHVPSLSRRGLGAGCAEVRR
jgi:hypothetical protein